MLRYAHAVPFYGHLSNEASLGQSTNQLYPTIFSFLLASLLRKSIALHSLWFLKSVQHSMPQTFQKVVPILLISFPGAASLVPGYSRAAAASLGIWHLHVHLLGQHFPQATLACWACIVIGYSSSAWCMSIKPICISLSVNALVTASKKRKNDVFTISLLELIFD